MIADDGLADRIRHGDPDAFRAFYATCSGPLLGYLAGMVGDRAAAEDLLQETLLRVFRNIASYEERGAFRSWVFRIATHLALSELRRRGRAAASPLDDRVLELPDPSRVDPAEHLEDEERRRIVESGLLRLPPEQRAVLLLRVREDMDIGEIARTLGVPEGTVKSRIHHAVRQLRKLAEQWDEPLTEQRETRSSAGANRGEQR